jgi:hypothetical protein
VSELTLLGIISKISDVKPNQKMIPVSLNQPMNLRLTHVQENMLAEISPFSSQRAPLGARWADSSRHVQKPPSHHPQIGERKQREELLGVSHQAPVAHLESPPVY